MCMNTSIFQKCQSDRGVNLFLNHHPDWCYSTRKLAFAFSCWLSLCMFTKCQPTAVLLGIHAPAFNHKQNPACIWVTYNFKLFLLVICALFALQTFKLDSKGKQKTDTAAKNNGGFSEKEKKLTVRKCSKNQWSTQMWRVDQHERGCPSLLAWPND